MPVDKDDAYEGAENDGQQQVPDGDQQPTNVYITAINDQGVDPTGK